MKTVKSICVFLLLAAVAMPGAGEESFRTDINPALQYYQAFLMAPQPPMSQADQDYLDTKDGRRWTLPERFGQIVAGSDIEFRFVRPAAHSKAPCDWGIDMSAGPATLFVHLAPAKMVAVAASMRVRWELQHDQQAEARDDLLATLALGRNLSRCPTMLCTLVEMAVEAMTCNMVVENFGRFSPETLKQLADGFDAPPARGTVAGCIPSEKAMFQNLMASMTRDLQKVPPGHDAEMMEALRGVYAHAGLPWHSPGDDTKALPAFRQMYTDALHAEPVYQKLAVMTTCPYREFENQNKAFEAEVQKLGNPLVSMMTPPGWEQNRRREFRILVYLAMIRAAVEYKLHGDSGLVSVADPCGQGPFLLRRFVFQGVDRGFQLTSAIAAADSKSLIFVEKDGDPFHVDGPHVGEACK